MYQVQPSAENKKFFRVVKAYFIYDKREEALYREYASESNMDEENQYNMRERAGSNPQARRLGTPEGGYSLPIISPMMIQSQGVNGEWDVSSAQEQMNGENQARPSQYRSRMDSFEIEGLQVSNLHPNSQEGEAQLEARAVNSELATPEEIDRSPERNIDNRDSPLTQELSLPIPHQRPRFNSNEDVPQSGSGGRPLRRTHSGLPYNENPLVANQRGLNRIDEEEEINE